MLADHAYSVDAVITNRAGKAVALRLRNPWGLDGVKCDGRDDGYVTVTGGQMLQALWMATAAI